MAFDDPLFWTALLKIVGVNAILSGDNAGVIALAARSLPERQRRRTIFWGAGAAAACAALVVAWARWLTRRHEATHAVQQSEAASG